MGTHSSAERQGAGKPIGGDVLLMRTAIAVFSHLQTLAKTSLQSRTPTLLLSSSIHDREFQCSRNEPSSAMSHLHPCHHFPRVRVARVLFGQLLHLGEIALALFGCLNQLSPWVPILLLTGDRRATNLGILRPSECKRLFSTRHNIKFSPVNIGRKI